MKKMLLTAAIALMAGFAQKASAQANLDFKVTNHTGIILYSLQVGASSSSEWGDDLLPKDVIGDGEEADVHFARSAENTCKWDIKVTKDPDGKTYSQILNINLCHVSEVILTVENGEIVYSTK